MLYSHPITRLIKAWQANRKILPSTLEKVFDLDSVISVTILFTCLVEKTCEFLLTTKFLSLTLVFPC